MKQGPEKNFCLPVLPGECRDRALTGPQNAPMESTALGELAALYDFAGNSAGRRILLRNGRCPFPTPCSGIGQKTFSLAIVGISNIMVVWKPYLSQREGID